MFLCVQVGGVWHKDAVLLLREALLNRSVDIEVMVGLCLHTYIVFSKICCCTVIYSDHCPWSCVLEPAI